jgi:hypothetical protein
MILNLNSAAALPALFRFSSFKDTLGMKILQEPQHTDIYLTR